MWQDGKIDILANDGAISYYADIFEDTLDEWRKTQALNLEAILGLEAYRSPHSPPALGPHHQHQVNPSHRDRRQGRGVRREQRAPSSDSPSPSRLNWRLTEASPMPLRRGVPPCRLSTERTRRNRRF